MIFLYIYRSECFTLLVSSIIKLSPLIQTSRTEAPTTQRSTTDLKHSIIEKRDEQK